MTIERIACIGFCMFITPLSAAAQQRSEAFGQALTPVMTVIEQTHAAGDAAPWRRQRTRSESGGREVIVETSELPDLEGKFVPVEEIVVETTRPAPNTAHIRRDVFGFPSGGRRSLLKTTESIEQTVASGDASVVHNTWVTDLNGHRRLTSRQLEQTRADAGVRQTDTTLVVPDVNEALREIERTQYTERRTDSNSVQYATEYLVRDTNGRWQPVETRRRNARATAAENVEEETVERHDVSGKLALAERNVTRRFNSNGQDHEVIETFAPYADGFARSDSRLAMSQRVRRTMTTAADGRRLTVEEVEGRNPVAPGDPMRLIRRTVTDVRQIGTDRWVTERQIFERDVNGQLRVVFSGTEERVGQ